MLIYNKNIINNNIKWNIYSILLEESLNYFKNNDINKNKIIHNDLIECIPNCNYMNLSNLIVYDNIIKPKLQFLNYLDNIFYDVYKIIYLYLDAPIIIYFCNINNPFCLVQISNYMDFAYIIYLNEKKIIEISHSTCGHQYYLDSILNFIATSFYKNIKNNICNKYIYTCFNNNIGHHLWNELSGLFYFLDENKYHNLIDGIVIGPYDYFNIEAILLKKYNFKILKFNNLYNSNNYIELLDVPLFINSFYINNKIQNLLFDFLEFNNSTINVTKTIELIFEFRTLRRCLISQDTFYNFIINKLLLDDNLINYNFVINLCGIFSTNCFKCDENNKDYIEQTKIVNNIINKNKNNRIIFNNLIGKDFHYISNCVKNSNMSILQMGTSISNLLNWTLRIKCIAIGPIEAYNWTTIQFTVLKNFECIYLPIEYITESNGLQGNFNINYDLFYSFYINELLKTIQS